MVSGGNELMVSVEQAGLLRRLDLVVSAVHAFLPVPKKNSTFCA